MKFIYWPFHTSRDFLTHWVLVGSHNFLLSNVGKHKVLSMFIEINSGV